MANNPIYSPMGYAPSQTYSYYGHSYTSPQHIPFSGQFYQLPQHQPRLPQQYFTPSWFDRRSTNHHIHNTVARPAIHNASQMPPRGPGPETVPDVPRGPPRKPKQSGHAIWIGNLPVNTTIHELKDFCARDADTEIESVFLLAKSNCAFANYSSLRACEAALSRFRSVPFHGRRLVCRLRMQPGSNASSESKHSSVTSTVSDESTTSPSTAGSVTAPPTPDQNSREHPVIVGGNTPPIPQFEPEVKPSPMEPSSLGIFSVAAKVPERFFIIKSLTVQDLVASVNNGTWEAQAHNEATLQHAFEHSDNVYLIFSANKSGEYFGLARMTSTMRPKRRGEESNHKSTTTESQQPSQPYTMATPKTHSAPSGKIYDDSARGTIFWEADRTVMGEQNGQNKHGDAELPQSKQFNIEWLSTSRVPFYMTRGLRNPWNGLKEVKIARDGTELEPQLGRHLVRLFRSS